MNKDVAKLREELGDVFDKLLTEKIEPKRAHELSNSAGKMIASVGLELKYAYQRGLQPSIPFLDTPETKAMAVAKK